MKIILTFRIGLFSAILLSFFSCTDHQIPQEDHWRVKSLTRVLPDSPGTKFISLFSYNQNQQLASIFTYQTPDSASASREKSTYQYDSLGRLAGMERTLSSGGGERYTYIYDQAGILSKINYVGAPDNYYDMTFTHDGLGKLVRSRRYFNYFHAISYEQLNSYSFSGDNLGSVHTESTVVRAVPATSTVNTMFAYDDHKNPFFGNFIIPAPVKIASPTTGNFGHYTYYVGQIICCI